MQPLVNTSLDPFFNWQTPGEKKSSTCSLPFSFFHSGLSISPRIYPTAFPFSFFFPFLSLLIPPSTPASCFGRSFPFPAARQDPLIRAFICRLYGGRGAAISCGGGGDPAAGQGKEDAARPGVGGGAAGAGGDRCYHGGQAREEGRQEKSQVWRARQHQKFQVGGQSRLLQPQRREYYRGMFDVLPALNLVIRPMLFLYCEAKSNKN